jgi:hypothetical protein
MTMTRWPHILTNIIATMSAIIEPLSSSSDPAVKAKLEEGKVIIAQVQVIKDEMKNDSILRCVSLSPTQAPSPCAVSARNLAGGGPFLSGAIV